MFVTMATGKDLYIQEVHGLAIAAAVLIHCEDGGCKIVGLDNMNSYYDPGIKEDRLAMLQGADKEARFEFVQGDLCDATLIEKLFADSAFDIVVNLAAQAGVRYSIENPAAYIDANLVGFFNVLEACRHHSVKHLIYASSSSVYGPMGRPDMAYFKFADILRGGGKT